MSAQKSRLYQTIADQVNKPCEIELISRREVVYCVLRGFDFKLGLLSVTREGHGPELLNWNRILRIRFKKKV